MTPKHLLYLRMRDSAIEIFVPTPGGKTARRYLACTGTPTDDDIGKAVAIRDEILLAEWGSDFRSLLSLSDSSLPDALVDACRNLNALSSRYGPLRMSTIGLLGVIAETPEFSIDGFANLLDTVPRNITSQLAYLSRRGFLRKSSYVDLSYVLDEQGDALLAEWKEMQSAVCPKCESVCPKTVYLSIKKNAPDLMAAGVAHLLLLKNGVYSLDSVTAALGNSRPAATQALLRLRRAGFVTRTHGGIAERPTALQRYQLTTKGEHVLFTLFGFREGT